MRKVLAAIACAAALTLGGCVTISAAPHESKAQVFQSDFKKSDTTGYTGSMTPLENIAKSTCALMKGEGAQKALDDSSMLAIQNGINTDLWAEVTFSGVHAYCPQYMGDVQTWANNHK